MFSSFPFPNSPTNKTKKKKKIKSTGIAMGHSLYYSYAMNIP